MIPRKLALRNFMCYRDDLPPLDFDGIRIAGHAARRASTMAWVTAVTDACALGVRGFVAQLSVAPLPTKFDPSTGLPPQRYLNSLVAGVRGGKEAGDGDESAVEVRGAGFGDRLGRPPLTGSACGCSPLVMLQR